MTLEELYDYRKLRLQRARAWEALEVLRQSAYPETGSMTGMPGGSGSRKDSVGDLAIELVRMRAQIEDMDREIEQADLRFSAFVDTIADFSTRIIVRLRFYSCCSWAQIAEVLGGKIKANSVRMSCVRYLTSNENLCAPVR